MWIICLYSKKKTTFWCCLTYITVYNFFITWNYFILSHLLIDKIIQILRFKFSQFFFRIFFTYFFCLFKIFDTKEHIDIIFLI